MEPYIKQYISSDFSIIKSLPTGRPYSCMVGAYSKKSLSVSFPSTLDSPRLFYTTLSLFLLHFIAKVWHGIPYSRTAFTYDISPVLIFVLASTKSPEESLLILFFAEVEDLIFRNDWYLGAHTMDLKPLLSLCHILKF